MDKVLRNRTANLRTVLYPNDSHLTVISSAFMDALITTFLIIIITMKGCKSEKSEYHTMVEFGQKYTDTWNSKQPEKMASFYAKDGMLTLNNGTPAVGRKQLAETA